MVRALFRIALMVGALFRPTVARPSAPPPAGGRVAPLFKIDWSTGDLLDSGKAIPLDEVQFGATNHLSVVSAAGLGFPAGMANCLQCNYPAGTQSYTFLIVRDKWSYTTGSPLYRRVFRRVGIQNAEGDQSSARNSNHFWQCINPSGPSSDESYEHCGASKNDGTWNWLWASVPWGHGYVPGAAGAGYDWLPKFKVWCFEECFTPKSSTQFAVDLRITDELGVLRYDKNNIYGRFGGDPSLAADIASNTWVTAGDMNQAMRSIGIGLNGGNYNFTNPQTDHWGGLCVRSDDWCGASWNATDG